MSTILRTNILLSRGYARVHYDQCNMVHFEFEFAHLILLQVILVAIQMS